VRFTICRIVGNELPPRDTPNSKLQCLRWLLDFDKLPDVQYVYLVNQIVDPEYREVVLQMLQGQTVIEREFDIQKYRACRDFHAKILYAIDINGARNFGFEHCRKDADFVAILDQESYYQRLEMRAIIERIQDDQRHNPLRMYYGTKSRRFHYTEFPDDPAALPEAESMLIMRHDADKRFDTSLKFGDGEKIALLQQLGYKFNGLQATIAPDALAKDVGICMHISFGDAKAEKETLYRGDLRQRSLHQLIETIDRIYPEK